MRNFIGRELYSERLEKIWVGNKTRIISFYGRRRVGKTELIHHFCSGKAHFYFEGLENGDTEVQIKHFLHQLSLQTGEAHLKDLAYSDWPPVLELLFQKIEKEKHFILIFDELPWMAAGRSKFISLLKHYWDKQYKQHPHLLFILCGSAASWMLKNVIRSNALYGRTSESFWVQPLEPDEVAEFIGKKRGQKEILEYLLCFGGIPRYLEEFNFSESLQLNIERTCFDPSGFFIEEAEKIFYSQFKEIKVYQQICKFLLKAPANLNEVALYLKMPSGGGLKQYLENLVAAGIVEDIPQLKDFKAGKISRYYLVDEFLRFHESFVQPNMQHILRSKIKNRFEHFTHEKWPVYLGYAFERFCIKQRYILAEKLGFDSKIIACGPVYSREDKGYQYDLVYLRKDGVITVCEMKYQSSPIGTKIISEMEQKLSRTHFPKNYSVEKILISNQKATQALEESDYFHQIFPIQKLWEK